MAVLVSVILFLFGSQDITTVVSVNLAPQNTEHHCDNESQ